MTTQPLTDPERHYLGPDLLAPCDEPMSEAERVAGFTRLTPVLTDVTCVGCINFLTHA